MWADRVKSGANECVITDPGPHPVHLSCPSGHVISSAAVCEVARGQTKVREPQRRRSELAFGERFQLKDFTKYLPHNRVQVLTPHLKKCVTSNESLDLVDSFYLFIYFFLVAEQILSLKIDK